MNKKIALMLARAAFTILIFIITVLITSHRINRSQPEDFVRMGEAVFPTVHLTYGETNVNLMHGYAREMDVAAMKSPLYITGEDRTVSVAVDDFGTQIDSASFEIRTMDGQNLVEQTAVSLQKDPATNLLTATFTPKELIEYDKEYMLVIVLTFQEKQAHYYCRLSCVTDETLDYLDEHIRFVLGFHEDIYTRPASADMFLESNASGREDTFEHVTIHSRMEAVTFAGMTITNRTTPLIEINDTHHRYASISLRYNITITEEDKERTCHVVEEYFTRRGNDGMYLIDFERRLNYVFSGKKEEISGSTIDLFCISDDLLFEESEGGNVFAFVNEGRLYVCQQSENRITQVYGFYENAGTEDVRTAWQGAKIKILRVDASGSVIFRVRGYMNRGRHEGETGTLLLSFDPQDNAVSELVFIDSVQCEEVLMAGEDATGFVNRRGVYYTMIGKDLYAIDLYEGGVHLEARGVSSGQMKLSPEGEIIAWQENEDSRPTQIKLLDMQNDESATIRAGNGECLKLLGFIGTDVIYGAYFEEAVLTDELKGDITPMHRIVIASPEGAAQTVYDAPDLPVTDVIVEETRVVLHRIRIDGTSFTEAPDDQIMSTAETTGSVNGVQRVRTEQGMRTSIAMSRTMDREKTRFMSVQEALPDAIRTNIDSGDGRERYYCMDHRRVAGIFETASPAVQMAYQSYGVALDETNRILYYRGNQTTRNQIMTLTSAVERTDVSDRDPASACLQAMLEYEGAGRNAESLLRKGGNAADILQEALPDSRVLDLTGCPLEVMYHYIDLMNDVPVMAGTGEGTYVLLLGFNDSEVVFYNPARGTDNVYKVPVSEAKRLFEENGNRFLTYIR